MTRGYKRNPPPHPHNDSSFLVHRSSFIVSPYPPGCPPLFHLRNLRNLRFRQHLRQKPPFPKHALFVPCQRYFIPLPGVVHFIYTLPRCLELATVERPESDISAHN